MTAPQRPPKPTRDKAAPKKAARRRAPQHAKAPTQEDIRRTIREIIERRADALREMH